MLFFISLLVDFISPSFYVVPKYGILLILFDLLIAGRFRSPNNRWHQKKEYISFKIENLNVEGQRHGSGLMKSPAGLMIEL